LKKGQRRNNTQKQLIECLLEAAETVQSVHSGCLFNRYLSHDMRHRTLSTASVQNLTRFIVGAPVSKYRNL
jgi:hypothetical protein